MDIPVKLAPNCIVVGVDLLESGDHALRHAMALAQKLLGSELHVVYVIKTRPSLHDAKKLDQISEELSTKVDELREHVALVCAPLAMTNPFIQETICHIRIGNPAEAIHQLAVDCDADLIVVGTHDREGVDRWILGSVAETLVRSAHVPVLVVRPKDYEGLPHSPEMEPGRPGEDTSAGMSRRIRLEIVPRNTHISGLI